MDFTFTKAPMLQALTAALAVIPTRTPRPVLQCVRIDSDGEKAVVSATDTEIGIRSTVNLTERGRVGACLLPAERFMRIVRESAADTIRVSVSESQATIKSGSDRFKLLLAAVDDFPPVAESRSGSFHELPAKAFHRLFERTAFAADSESSRYALMGVLLEFHDASIYAVGTDGRRLSWAKADAQCVDNKQAEFVVTIVPSRAIPILAKAFRSSGNVRVSTNGNSMFVQDDEAFVSLRLVEGRFPRWRDVIPKPGEIKAVVSASDFLAAVKRATVVSMAEDNAVTLAFRDEKLAISVPASEFGTAEIEIPIKLEGGDVSTAVNHHFVTDYLRTVESGVEVSIAMQSSNDAVLVSDGEDSKYVIMPLSPN